MFWMRRFCVGLICLSSIQLLNAQFRIVGFVYDATEDPYVGIEVRLRGDETRRITFTDTSGRFEFTDVPRGEYSVVVITGYGLIEREVNLRASIEMHMQRPRNIRMDDVLVSSVRAPGNAPIAVTNVSGEEISRLNLGADVPYVLGFTPSLVETSDAGTGIGYTGMRIRGTDPTRINVTINGVPLNDAESQSVYWVDLPDLLSSTESIQVQRGVGSSTFGSGAFGASVNLNTVRTETDPYGSASLGAGSFGTWRGNVRAGTGLLNNHFTIDGRASMIRSDGFIDRASAELYSGHLTAAYIGATQSLRLNVLHGHEQTYQAWNGVPIQYVSDPVLRTYNTAGTERNGDPYDNEVDRYTQTHYQLMWNASVLTQLQPYATLHYTRGKGYFEQYKSVENHSGIFGEFLATHGLDDGDAVRRRWLDNHFFGVIGGFHFFDPSNQYMLQAGGAWHRYLGDHYGEAVWSAAGPVAGLGRYYFNDAGKSDASGFVKFNRNLSPKLELTADLQLRGIRYHLEGINSDGRALLNDVSFTFFNPKLGLSWTADEAHRLYAFFGVAQREPNRDDFIDSSPASLPRPEKLFNTEAGWQMQRGIVNAGVNLYHMHYRDQLVLTGRINDVGEYNRENVDKSYRAGMETTLAVTPGRWDFRANLTLSRNRVRAFDEYIDDWSSGLQSVIQHSNTPLAFSPDLIASGEAGFLVIAQEKHEASIALMAKHVGRQYLDNSGNEASRLDAYTFFDVHCAWTKQTRFGALELQISIRNVLDAQFSTNGWIYRFLSPGYDPRPDDPYARREHGNAYHLMGLFPQAGRNVLAGMTVRF